MMFLQTKYKTFLFYLLLWCPILLIGSNVLVHDPKLVNAAITSKLFGFYDLMPYVSAGVMILLLFKKTEFRLVPADWGILAFCTWSLFSDRFILSGSVVLLSGICYFCIRLMLQTTKQVHIIPVYVLILSGIIEISTGFSQLYGFTESHHSMYRTTGSFANPGPYSGFIAIILPLAFYWAFKKYPAIQQLTSDKWKEILRSPEQIKSYLLFSVAAIYIIGALTILPAGMSRSAWIAAAAGCTTVWGRHYNITDKFRKCYRTHQYKTLAYSTLAIFLLAGICTGMYLMKKGSADGRLLMWKVSLLAMKEQPLQGVGAGHFPGTFGRAQAEYFASGRATPQEELVAGSPEYGFNEYLQIGVEHGIIGLLLFLFIMGAALCRAAKSNTEGTNGLIGALTSLLVFACFSYPFSTVPLCITSVMLLAMCATQETEEIRKSKKWKTQAFALCLMCLTLYTTRDKEIKRTAYVKWAEEKIYFNMNIFEKTVDNYRNLYPQLKDQPAFLFEYGQCLSKTGQYEESNRILHEGTSYSADPMLYNIIGKNYQAMKQYDKAEEAFLHASQMIPHRLYPLYLLAGLYFDCGQTGKAMEMARQVIAKEPKVMSTAVKEMKEEMLQKIKGH